MPSTSRTALIVTSSGVAGAAYARHFERRGWSVAVVTGLADAERKAVRVRPRVLVVDILSLDETKRDIKRLKALPTLLGSAIVVLARRATQADIGALIAAGADEVVLTPHTTPAHFVLHIDMKYSPL